jgi:hypothetical protein
MKVNLDDLLVIAKENGVNILELMFGMAVQYDVSEFSGELTVGLMEAFSNE